MRADETKRQRVNEPATPTGPRMCTACGYQMGQAICTHCGKPAETAGQRIAREWYTAGGNHLADLARRIDEDRAAVLADMEASDIAALALHEILAAIGEALGCDGPASGDALVAHAAELRQERDALAEEVALDNKLLAERDRVLDALPCPQHGRCVPGAIERIAELTQVETKWNEARRNAPRWFPIQTERGAKVHPLRVPRSVAEKAYSVYAAKYGRSQSLERLAERGGFCPSEMDDFVLGWREEASEIAALKAELAALACATHRACTREPGDCCAIGSVISRWDKEYNEATAELDRALGAEAEAVAQLRAALLATRDHDEPDGPCWCPAGLSSEAGCRHTPRCLQARATLGIGQVAEPTP